MKISPFSSQKTKIGFRNDIFAHQKIVSNTERHILPTNSTTKLNDRKFARCVEATGGGRIMVSTLGKV